MIDKDSPLIGQNIHPEGRDSLRRHNRRRIIWIIVVIIVLALLVSVLWPSSSRKAQGRNGMTGPVPVVTATATRGDIGVTLSALGTVTPLATVTVHTQISGLLMQLGFKEGQMVKKGDFLAQIDPRPYEAQLQQYEGQLAKDEAALADARLDLKRYQTLVAQDSLARQTLDTQKATVHQDEGAIKTDQAQIDTARLNLIYCHITAPASGRIGLRQVDTGNFVQPSDANGIVIITQLQPISVIFVLPEDNIDQIAAQLRTGGTLQVTAFDRTNSTKLAVGTLETIDNQIDPTTGTVKLRALFDNPGQALFPNQFVNAQLLVNTLHSVITIPSAAIQRGAPGTYVYLIKPDHTVAVTPITLGPADQQNVAVTAGLNEGDRIVIDGADKLKDDARVTLPGEQPQSETNRDKSDDKAADKSDQDNETHHHSHHRGGNNQSNQSAQ